MLMINSMKLVLMKHTHPGRERRERCEGGGRGLRWLKRRKEFGARLKKVTVAQIDLGSNGAFCLYITIISIVMFARNSTFVFILLKKLVYYTG